MKRSLLLSLALASTMLLASCGTSTTTTTSTAPAGTEQATAPTYAVFAEDGVAILGSDPVAYFTEGEYTPGTEEFTHEWEGATWQFASAENRDLFAANPEEYAPQYGGFCAYAVSQGNTASIEPTAWKIVDGKLYLNYNDKIQERWAKDIPGHIAQADENWPGVLAN